jgi:hypothetical protein
VAQNTSHDASIQRTLALVSPQTTLTLLLRSLLQAEDGQARRVGASLSQEGPEGMGAANSAEDGALECFACCKRDEQSSRYLVSHQNRETEVRGGKQGDALHRQGP